MKIASRLEAVTVYARGAICERVAAVPAGAGLKLTVTGLPLSLKAGSLRTRTSGGPSAPTVVEVRPGLEVTQGEAIDVSAEQRALDAAEAALAKLSLASTRVQRELEDVRALEPSYREPKEGEPPREAPVEATLQLSTFVGETLPGLQAQKRSLDEQLKDASHEVHLRRRRLAEASSAKNHSPTRVDRTAEITLSAAPAEPFSLTLEYQVAGARWTPMYELRLARALAGGVLFMRASVAQCSGEDWVGVRLALSTADLDRRVERPELRSIRIGRSQPAPPRSGFRDPPSGLDALFGDYDALAARQGGATSRHGLGFGAVLTPARSVSLPRPTPAVAAVVGGLARAEAMVAAQMMAPPAPPPPAPKSARVRPTTGIMPVMAAAPAARSAPPRGMAKDVESISRRRSSRDDDELSLEMEAPEEAPEAAFDDGDGYGALGGGGPGGMATVQPALAELEVDASMLDYDLMRMGGPAEPTRGRLKSASAIEVQAISVSVQIDVLTAIFHGYDVQSGAVDRLVLPHYCSPPRESAGTFDYRYVCASPIDVPSVATWRVVPVASADVMVSAEYQCVPSVEPKVYRTVQLKNRSGHALLKGPVDVFVGEGFLLTAELPTLPPAGDAQTLGLGVEEAIKVARNTTFRETTGGLLGGSTVLPHEIAIELENRTGAEATVEVRERVPVSSDDEVKIEETKVEPAWKKDEAPRDGAVTKGARAWKVTLGAGEKKKLLAEYTVRIPSSRMLEGGNRRV